MRLGLLRADPLCLCLVLTTGVDAVFGEILVTLAKIDWIINHGEAALKPSKRAGNLLLAHKVSHVHYEPLGVTLALVSWNYSFHNLISPILASVFAGNAVVVKCSEQVAWSSQWFIGAIRACLRSLGYEEDIVQLIICLPDVAETVTRNPLVKHITCEALCCPVYVFERLLINSHWQRARRTQGRCGGRRNHGPHVYRAWRQGPGIPLA